MKRRVIKLLSTIVLAAILFQTIACGTILYPERKGQTAGHIDPAVAILDGIGLLFFLVPGVIAFAVDFTTGAIYLPKGQKSILDGSNGTTNALNVADVDPETLDLDTLELIVSDRIGKSVDLKSENCTIYQVHDPDFTGKHFVKVSAN